MHFCGGLDDLLILLMFVPGLSFAISWIRAKLHHRKAHKDCDHG